MIMIFYAKNQFTQDTNSAEISVITFYNLYYMPKQENIPVGCVPPTRNRTGGSLSGGVLSQGEGTWDQSQRSPLTHRRNIGPIWLARQDMTSYRDPLSPGQTYTCKNITLPQTSFAGGNNTNAKLVMK